MNLEEAKDVMRYIGTYNEDGSVGERPELGTNGVKLGRGSLTADVRVGKQHFISIPAGSAFDPAQIADMKARAAEAAEVVAKAEAEAEKVETAKSKRGAKKADTPTQGEGEQEGK